MPTQVDTQYLYQNLYYYSSRKNPDYVGTEYYIHFSSTEGVLSIRGNETILVAVVEAKEPDIARANNRIYHVSLIVKSKWDTPINSDQFSEFGQDLDIIISSQCIDYHFPIDCTILELVSMWWFVSCLADYRSC